MYHDSNIMILSNGFVLQCKTTRTGNSWTPNANIIDSSGMIGAAGANYGTAYAGERTMHFGTEWNGTLFKSHSASNSSNASGTLYGAILASYATNSQVEAFIGKPFSPNKENILIKYI